MTWIKTIPYEEACGKLRKLYNRVKGPDNNVDNILLAHGLRPASLQGHMGLYKSVLHHSDNSLPKWLLEAIGLCVSLLNKCPYCVEHHYAGMKVLIGDDARSTAIRTALEADLPSDAFHGRELALMQYATILTRNPDHLTEDHIKGLRAEGLSDGEILEANQVAAYFSYANRTVLGLGVRTTGDIIGLSPNDTNDPDNWSHN